MYYAGNYLLTFFIYVGTYLGIYLLLKNTHITARLGLEDT